MYDYEFSPQKVWSIWANGACVNWIYECLGHRCCQTCPQVRQRRLYVRTKFSQSSVFYSNFISAFHESDAVIVTTSYAYESVSLDAVKQWFSDMQKEVHVLGPLLPPGYGTETQNSEEGLSVDIETFLGEMLVQHGKRSVFFVRSFPLFFCVRTSNHNSSQVSFGSLHWPSVPEYVDELIEALIAKKAPFVRWHLLFTQ